MDTTDIDYQLSSMAEPLPQAAELEARRMASASGPRRLRKGRALRPRWVLPTVVGTVVALTAGAGTATVSALVEICFASCWFVGTGR